MSKVLLEPGNQVPKLILVRADRVLPGDIVWGVQYQPNLRKGFILEVEGWVCEKGSQPVGDVGYVRVGPWPEMHPGYMVLVQQVRR